MNNLHKSFTFGFEIEGAFESSSMEKIKKKATTDFYDFEEQSDGSVNVEIQNSPLEGKQISTYDEISLGIFHTYSSLLKYIKKFNENNYIANDTCGFHIHIATQNKELNNRIQDDKFIFLLQKFIKNHFFCECLSHRLGGDDTYFKSYRNGFFNLYEEWKQNKKYALIRNHPQKTYEFRFFAPCKHKAANMTTFFNYFFKELKNVKGLNKKTFILPEIKEREIIIADTIPIKSKNINLKM